MSRETRPLGQSDIFGVFAKFWTVFLAVTSKAQLPVAPLRFPFKIEVSKKKDLAEVSLTNPLHLKNWPYKAASHATSLHVIVNGTESINLAAHKTIKSWVQVVYYQEKPNDAHSLVPIEAIHYDYKAAPDPAHPVFHAHFCRDAIDQDQKNLIETLKDFEMQNDLIGDRYGHLKIPTAHMNLVSVLLCLCADHIPKVASSSSLKILFDEIRAIKEMPTVEATTLTRGIDSKGSYCSMHWYVF